MPENSLLNCYLGIQKYSFRSSPLSWRVEHTINRILGTSTPLFLKAQNCPVLALTKINVVLYSCRSKIKGFLKMLLNQFVCGRYDSRAQRLPVHRQLEGSGSRESELVTSESWGGRLHNQTFMWCQKLDTRVSFIRILRKIHHILYLYTTKHHLYLRSAWTGNKRLN